ncbi:uncharacterized protein BP5553_03435 [Venustampulla echinocandica]|uniref:Uncharacterized protein n=1 Tax=Venustampulla echinocandica TaxID=2656787 RepID=A0A370TU89_9HELO|nr:uncharacterized protein BP5553_03435 [Venustampulla echinocandica]RDL39095.1 hypothetical protein BP5553_03435 [Venustampulla echinocandica]
MATPQSPALAGFSPIAEDEQIVNTAILLLLNTLTAYHPDLGIGSCMEWTMKRKVFRCGPSEARTDGFLRDARHTTRAILEVKPFVRGTNSRAIRMREAAQLAAWNFSEAPQKGTTVQDSNGIFRRLLISQDSTEIYLTISEFDQQYLDYITGLQQPPDQQRSFTYLVTMGPWFINKESHTRDLGSLLLAFTLHQSKLLEPSEGADPFTSASPGTEGQERFQTLPIRQPPRGSGRAPIQDDYQQGESSRPSTRPHAVSTAQDQRADKKDKNDKNDKKDKREKNDKNDKNDKISKKGKKGK